MDLDDGRRGQKRFGRHRPDIGSGAARRQRQRLSPAADVA